MAKAADSERRHGILLCKSRLAGGVALPETADVSQSVVKVDPEIMSGAPCFTGTRVPIQNLIDYWKVEIQ